MQDWYHYCLIGNGCPLLDMLGTAPTNDNAGLIWNRIAVPKHRFIFWHARLLTKDKTSQDGIHPNMCSL
uniref:Putative ovule protein n=1 Tax=Solanum chacoense TaxID=4108 RepID=A0A0V0HW58_SOLCH